MRITILRFTLILIAHSFLAINPAYAIETINQFTSHLVVNNDASIDVAETISVHSEGNQIVHGLVRRLPLHYVDSYGINRRTQYDITNILLDMAPTHYEKKTSGGMMSIYIGDASVFLVPGKYTYTIQYHVVNAVNFLKDADEIYWNITGNDWSLPIEHAQATITLPQQAIIARAYGYTGTKGSRGQNYTASKISSNQIEFATSSPLQAGEGFTIATAWQKGIIIPPTFSDELKQQFQSNVVILFSIIILFYYSIVWLLRGRDPKLNTIIPLFEPPENLTPEAMRYITRMGFDTKTLTCAIVSLATKGYLTIEDNLQTYTLKKTNRDDLTLPAEEAALAVELFGNSDTIVLTNTNQTKIAKSKRQLMKALAQTYKNSFFKTNSLYLIPGVLLSLIAAVSASSTADDISTAFINMISLPLILSICYRTLQTSKLSLTTAYNNLSLNTIWRTANPIFFSLILLAISFGSVIALVIIFPLLVAIPLFFILIANTVIFHAIKAPTAKGQAALEKIEGFKLYLSTTERYRLDQFKSPATTPALFEKYLPYAIALDVENEWGGQFNEVLKNAGITPKDYHPSWYQSSRPWSDTAITRLPLIIGTALSSSLSSVTVSSSASSGGGSSGGGGGGGGGGGW